MTPETKPTIFAADHVLTLEDDTFSPGGVAVKDGVILEVGDPEGLEKKYPDFAVETFPGGLIMPGLVNAQADLSLSLFPKLDAASPVSPESGLALLMPWLISVSRYKAKLGLEEQQLAVKKGLDAAKRSGVTTVGDVCRYPIALSSYEKSGLRMVCLAEIENIQRHQSQDDFEQALALVDEVLNGKNPLLGAGLAPFSAYTLSKNLLRILSHHALQLEIPIHLHAAMSFGEMEFFYDSLGEISAYLFKEAGWQEKVPPPHKMTPIQYLYEIGFLKAHPSLVGCLHLGPTDTALLAQNACLRIFAPKAFEYLQVGEVPWRKLFAAQIGWALGTMGMAAGTNLDLWDEMRCVWYAGEPEDRDGFATWILEAATQGGARALGLEKKIGSLARGKRADLLVVDAPDGDDSLAAGLIDQTRGENIRALYVDGAKIS